METQLEIFPRGVNRNEAPKGFYAVSKDKATTPNACNSCDAKNLCQKNDDEWCLKNRCVSYELADIPNKRNDGQSVIFKRIN